MKMTPQQRAYLAGLLDGDGSIMLQLKPMPTMRFKFRVKSIVVFYQDSLYETSLHEFQQWIGAGYVYRRNDHMSELRVEGHVQVTQLLVSLKPYIRFKRKQVSYMLQALQIASDKQTITTFLSICDLADMLSDASYVSRKRKYTAEHVRKVLREHHLIPVTTGLPTQPSA